MSELFASMPRSRALAAAALLWVLSSIGLAFFTPTQVPGYLHALALNVFVGTIGLWIAVTTGRLAARLEPGASGDLRSDSRGAMARLGAPAAAAAAVMILLVALSFALALANGLRVGLCEVWSTLPGYAVLPLPSALLSAVAGTLLAAATRRRLTAGLLAVAALLVSLVITAWPILAGPQAFAFNHLLGHVPGPLYDERFRIDGSVLAWRALSLSWAALLLGLGALLLRPAGEGFRLGWRPHFGERAALWLLAASLVAGGPLVWKRADLGFHQSHRSVAHALGGEVRTERFVIHYPHERSPEWVRNAVLDHEYQYDVVSEWLELDPDEAPMVRSYVFRSAAEKGRLTGAGRTSIAKPWLSAMYLNDRPYPHPVLRHELAHVLAGAFGSFPFRVSGRGLSMNSGLIEGLAVAADWPADELSVHCWASAMREVGVAPDIRGLFSASGFLSQSSARAYTLAGSFVRWLVDERGIEALKTAYRRGDLSAAGEAEELFAGWEAFLDARVPGEEALQLAEHRFRRPSILRRPCAFDVSAARRRARSALASRNYEEALAWFRRASTLEPQDPWHLKSLADTHVRAGDTSTARDVAEEILEHEGTDARLRAETLMILGDIAWLEEDATQASLHYGAVVELATGATARLAAVKSIAASDAALSEGLRPFLLREMGVSLGLLRMRELLEALPDEPLLHYLIGRQLHNAGEASWALDYLGRADDLGMSDVAGLRLECRRLMARALYDEAHDLAAAKEAWLGLAEDPGAGTGRRLQARDWARRAAFSKGLQE